MTRWESARRGDEQVADPILLVRPVAGSVGERERLVHVVGRSGQSDRPGVLRAFCGAEFNADELDLLDRVTGMPCEDCLRLVPLPQPVERNEVAGEPPFQPEPTGYVYEQLADHLAQLIESGRLRPGMPLPAERRLAQQYDVSLGTARHATQLLRARGLVVTVPAKGTFVADAVSEGGNRRNLGDQPETL